MEAKTDNPNSTLLDLISEKDKVLVDLLKATDINASEAIATIDDGREKLKKLRHHVSHDGAKEVVNEIMNSLIESGLSVDDLQAEAQRLAELNVAPVEEVQAPEQEPELVDMIKKAVPTLGQTKPVPKSHKSPQGTSSVDTIDRAEETLTSKAIGVPESTPIDAYPKTLFNGKFVRHENGEYKRVNEERVSMVDEEVRIRFVDKQMDTFQAAIELVAAKGWGAIEVNGSDKFRSEAWMHAAMAGLEVQGYEPSEVDLQRLEKEKMRRSSAGEEFDQVASSLRSAEVVAGMTYGDVAQADADRGRYTGKLVHETPFHVVQEHGKNSAVIHAKKLLGKEELKQALQEGADLRVEYRKGGIVSTKVKEKMRSKGQEI